MKRFDRVCVMVLLGMILVFVFANVVALFGLKKETGRPYRVEISRLVRQMEESGRKNNTGEENSTGRTDAGETPDFTEEIDISGCTYVTAVVKENGEGAAFYEGNSDYEIREIDGVRYRFEYVSKEIGDRTELLFLINGVLGVMATVVIFVLFYVRQNVLCPFTKMERIPYELSKGNLTVPLKESKNRFFGRFVWGVNLLRENMEQQKERELSLQKEKKTLLLSLSHDIKTPLSAIKLYAKALSKGLYSEPERQTGIAENINAKADEIEAFVSEIIKASNEDFLNFEVNMDEFYLSELMGEITEYYREKLKLIQTEFVVESYFDCLLKGDKDRAVEVLQNLMENAIKYGDGQRIEIKVSEEDGCILIAVKNFGCTLTETELPHIFESFWRGSNVGSRKGSGLGLYICRSLMRKMGGEVFAEVRNGEIAVTVVFQEV
ncbi:MAG: HAMP domain-containing sensor histidine kinase [Lachnospiraceae bacterium]|nr:HAMP domain-containing sensor histidine kinase [Lachnospiraceae bacterium]